MVDCLLTIALGVCIAGLLLLGNLASRYRRELRGTRRMVEFWRTDAIQKGNAGRQIWLELLDARRRLHEVTRG